MPFQGATPVAAAPKDERFEVTVRLRPRNPLPDATQMLEPAANPQAQMTHEEYDQQHGANPKDFVLLRRFAKEHNLAVVRESIPRRSVMLSGTVDDFNRAFGVDLKTYAYANGTYRGRTGPVHIPEELAGIV